ncbi:MULTISPECIES: aminotransferase class I/II-fold pyridoxal phosphate-dependent enzyme [unclassified Actinomyces]|uniref:aminotransferase class I/II-fold pyridoxal phosphate-dependent enzyme n=1 Tax=unclassified Actinomyces TaxID=2609248 RepID=UPI001374283C|nr:MULTISPECIES: aminotransferase class I/II-fold pyridoxal phosphate-dependent enzyme [unclassified Actinomyces]MBW3069170.1 aminotransferase class I/II-fold pyridoxal phosphate-dependent enzyme [Actinomyces sp. 594]NDR54591.1 aminotransferase class I/II-fold pyridoxal phosphate-dependent enzyme [Actinomyces sp. 565]QHO91005.1 aminotransferase [Actinomyces sp. 432]
MKLAQRAVTAPPFHAMSIGARAREIEARGYSVAKLSLGEPDFGAPPAVCDALARVAHQELPYTAAAGLPQLREAISRFYREHHDVQVDPERVLVTSGASAALLLAAALTTEPGDDVVIADPCYPCNRELVASFGGRIVLAPTLAESRYQLELDAMETAWTPYTNAVMMATPSNPTGTSIPYAELDRICRAARAAGAWRIVDEIYLGLADPDAQGRPARTVLALDPEAIVISSFSKFFGMTGWRLGWVVLPESLVEPARNLAVNYFLCASTPAQIAALEAFTPQSLAVCEQRRRELVERRHLALGQLRRLGLNIPVEPDGAFYIYFDVSDTGLSSWDFCMRALDEAHVALTPGRDFGVRTAESHVRLSYAASREEITEGLKRLGRFMSTLA